MPPAEPVDNQLQAALFAVLQGIVAGATYLTSPVVAEGVPPDPIPTVDQVPRLYVSHVRTDPATPARSGPSHHWTARFAAWIAAKTSAETNRVRADVLRALYASEFAISPAYMSYPLEFTRIEDAQRAGIHLAVQLIGSDYQTDHTST